MNPTPTATRRSRPGFTVLETVVAATLVLALLSVSTPMIVRSARIWKQTRNHQFATDELTVQLDRLIAMPAEQRGEAIDRLSVHPEVARVLRDASLSGTEIRDSDGVRIELQIDWERVGNPPPIRLVAWVDPLPVDSDETDSDDAEPEQAGADQ